MAWLDEEEDRPSRADWYAMQIAAEIRRTRVKDPGKVSINDMKLKMEAPKPPPLPTTREEAAAMAKSRWAGMLNVKRSK